MMLRPELVEAAAKAICARRNDAWAKFGWNCDAWEAITEVSREQYREDARAALGEMQREMNRVVAAVRTLGDGYVCPTLEELSNSEDD